MTLKKRILNTDNNFSLKMERAKQRIFARTTLVNNAETPFDVIYDNGLAKLRHYPPLAGYAVKYKTPLLFITPLAVGTEIYDLLEKRSLIKFLLQQGFSIYVIDWGKPTRKHAHLGFDYYISEVIPAIIQTVRDYSGEQEISTHGWSMGGMFSMIYSAYSKDKNIKNMILLGAPVDGHASGHIGHISQLLNQISEKTEKLIKLHPRHIPYQLMHSAGWMNVLAFKAVDPIGTAKNYIKMFKYLDDDVALEENATKNDFLLRMSDYPGRVIKDIGVDFWVTNKLIKGEFPLKNKIINLKDITANLLVISGSSDTLVSTESAQPIMNLVDSTDKQHIEIAGGHVAIVSSKKTCTENWPMLADWLAKRSTPVD